MQELAKRNYFFDGTGERVMEASDEIASYPKQFCYDFFWGGTLYLCL